MSQPAIPPWSTRLFPLECYGLPRALHSFPTRRSSDLLLISGAGALRTAGMSHFQDVDQVAMAAPLTRFARAIDRKSTRLNSSHRTISYAVFCLKKKKNLQTVAHSGTR